MYVKEQQGGNTLTDGIYYAYTDHLGSIVALTNASGGNKTAQNFDAWGRRRDPQTWAYTTTNNMPTWSFRGYTGHESLEEFDLINMNGRLYDPILGRMLSPDNYVQDATSTQGYNRYAYAMNNPLKYTDPSGEFIGVIVAGAIIGGYIGGWANSGEANPLKWSKDDWNTAAIGAIVGGGVGTGVAAFAGAPGTGFAAGLKIAGHGATQLGWTIISNALITANVNMASAALQGRDNRGIMRSGVTGLIAGAIGGYVGGKTSGLHDGENIFKALFDQPYARQRYTAMTVEAVKRMTTTTAVLNGFIDRVNLSVDKGLGVKKSLINGVKGGIEGFLLTRYSINGDKTLYGNKTFGLMDLIGNGRLHGRYLSTVVTQGITSWPGAGYKTNLLYGLPAHMLGIPEGPESAFIYGGTHDDYFRDYPLQEGFNVIPPWLVGFD